MTPPFVAKTLGGTSIHLALGIDIQGNLNPLNDRRWNFLQNKISEVKLVITKNVLMDLIISFFKMHEKLCKKYGCSIDKPFPGLPVISRVILYLLPLVERCTIYELNVSIDSLLS